MTDLHSWLGLGWFMLVTRFDDWTYYLKSNLYYYYVLYCYASKWGLYYVIFEIIKYAFWYTKDNIANVICSLEISHGNIKVL